MSIFFIEQIFPASYCVPGPILGCRNHCVDPNGQWDQRGEPLECNATIGVRVDTGLGRSGSSMEESSYLPEAIRASVMEVLTSGW